ncbi:MAG: porin family protein, partial [Bacteroidota bacterium]
CLVLAIIHDTQAQFSYGFKAGLNFSQLAGASEQNPQGEDLEEFNSVTGFHIGALFNYTFIDAFRLRGELMFSQKGTAYIYDGSSYRDFVDADGIAFSTQGNRRTVLNATNSYIDVPVSAVVRLGDLELSAGPSLGFLVNSVASGEIAYDVMDSNGEIIASSATLLDYNYTRDEATAPAIDVSTTTTFDINGRIAVLPEAEGAYFEYNSTSDAFYNRLDVGLHAQLAYFINTGLFIAARFNYGLSDATNDFYDRSLQTRNADGSFVERTDSDANRSLQLSLGFSF